MLRCASSLVDYPAKHSKKKQKSKKKKGKTKATKETKKQEKKSNTTWQQLVSQILGVAAPAEYYRRRVSALWVKEC